MESSRDVTELELVFAQNEANAWWPALAGDNIEQFFSVEQDPREKAKMATSYILTGDIENFRIVRLFDKDLCYKRRMKMIRKEDVPICIKDFYANLTSFKLLNRDNPKWQNAVLDVLNYFNGSGDTEDDDEYDLTVVSSPGGKLYGMAQSEQLIGHKNSPSAATMPPASPSVQAAPQAQKVAPKRKLFETTDNIEMKRPRRSSRTKQATGLQNINSSPPISHPKYNATSSRTTRSTRNSISDNAMISTEEPRRSQASTSSHVEVSPHDGEKSGRSTKLNGSEKSLVKRDKIRQDDEWETVWNILCESFGWFTIKGKGFVDCYYVKGEHCGKDATYIQKHLKLNTDYLTSEEQVKDFAYNNHKWRGPKGQEYIPHTQQDKPPRNKGTDTAAVATGKKQQQSQARSKKKTDTDRLRTLKKVEKHLEEWQTVISILEL